MRAADRRPSGARKHATSVLGGYGLVFCVDHWLSGTRLSPSYFYDDVAEECHLSCILLLAGGARCVRGRVANCRADPMVASSSAAATDPLLFFAGPGTPPPNSVGFLALYLRRTASGALRSSARQIGGAAISPLSRRSGTRWPCRGKQGSGPLWA